MKALVLVLSLCFLTIGVIPSEASSLKKVARISLACYPTDWDGDGVRDGLVWGVVFRDGEGRALSFRNESCTADLQLRSLMSRDQVGGVLLERKALAFRSNRDLNGLYPRHPWQRIAWSEIPADPARHARKGLLSVTIHLPGGKSLRGEERFRTVLYPRSAILPDTPRIEVMSRRTLKVDKGKAPGLKRVRLFATAVDDDKDGKKDAFVWWLAFRDDLGRPVHFEELPYTVELLLRGRSGKILHRFETMKGTSHRSFPALFPQKRQRLACALFSSQREASLEATISLGKKRYRAVERDFLARH